MTRFFRLLMTSLHRLRLKLPLPLRHPHLFLTLAWISLRRRWINWYRR